MLKFTPIESFPEKSNPFNYDLLRMGTQIGTNCMVMFTNFSSKPCQHLVIVNTDTGERLLVQLLPKESMIDSEM